MSLEIIDIIGFAASALVFLTFCMRTLLPLRLLAIASNLCFIAYSIGDELVPILVLHVLLLPMNLWRTAQHLQTRRRMQAIFTEEPDLDNLVPFTISEDYADGDVVFERGDPSGRMYIVLEGEVTVEEFGKTLSKGSLFGEIGLFNEDGKRTATVRASGPAKLGWIDRDTIMKIYRDEPDFALFLTRLMVKRLSQNEKEAA